MKINYCYILKFLIACLVLCPFYLRAQDTRRDNQTWLWFQLEKEFNKRWAFGVQYQLRWSDNINEFQYSVYYLNASYKPKKFMHIEAVYQYSTSYQTDIQSFYVGVTNKLNLTRWKLAYRPAFQAQIVHFNPIYSDEHGNEPVYEWRNRFTVRYKLFSNITPFVFAEPYLRMGYRFPYVDKIRNGMGVDYDMNKYNTFSLYFLFQPEYNFKYPNVQNVFGVVYSVTIPKKVKWHKFFKPKKIRVIEDDDEMDKDGAIDKL